MFCLSLFFSISFFWGMVFLSLILVGFIFSFYDSRGWVGGSGFIYFVFEVVVFVFRVFTDDKDVYVFVSGYYFW